jgi:hypothetical protein
MLQKFKKYLRNHLWKRQIIDNQRKLVELNETLLRFQQEQLKAAIFNSTISGSEWLKHKDFSTGGWAVDYAFLYTLYRVLNDTQPKKIIEFGLGQTSKMIHQYAKYNKDINAVTYEHDPEWVIFFNKGLRDLYPINIKYLELQTIEYNSTKTLSYKNIENELENQQFNLIVVDAPFASEHYSRSQVIKMVPDCLENSFCILIDDLNRPGEQETAQEIYKLLDFNKIKYYSALYSGSKEHLLICSEENYFLTSL